jgi:hypothetical protein
MGMFDTVYVSREVLGAFPFACRACRRVPEPGDEWQTKSLQSGMDSYFLRNDEEGAVRLYLLDRPSDRRFWRAWTDEEIAESERQAERGGLSALWRKKHGEGCFLPEAYRPENRRQRFMGELPHQWVEIYTHCTCGQWLERHVKFSDGVALEVRSEPPRHEPGFFDNSGGFDL